MKTARRQPAPEATLPPPTPSTIGARTSFHGEITGSGDLIVRGSLEGGARVEGRVRVSVGGFARSEIVAREIDLSGRAAGALRARARIHARAGCDLQGSATAARFLVEGGARLDDLEMRFERAQNPTPRD